MTNIEIEKNDIIGVCMRDTGGHAPLQVVDEEPPAGLSLYQYTQSIIDCNHADDVQNFIESDLNSSPHSFGLHAFVDVAGKIAVNDLLYLS